jgi:hypothetical protein
LPNEPDAVEASDLLNPSTSRFEENFDAYWIETIESFPRLMAPHEGTATRLTDNESFSFKDAQGFAQSSKAHAELTVEVDLARKIATWHQFTLLDAIQKGVTNLQIEWANLKVCVLIHGALPSFRGLGTWLLASLNQ